MSDSALKHINVGAYERPFSGVGIEYYPLGTDFDHTGFLIHEVGFLPQSKNWNFPSVFSPFWRLYYNFRRGHCVCFNDTFYELTPEQIMIIPDHRLFNCLGANPVPALWVAFNFKQSLSLTQPVPILLKPTKTELSLLQDIKHLILKNKNNDPKDAIYRFSLALLNLVITSPTIQWKKDLPLKLSNLLNYIRTNYSKKLSNSHLAEVGCLSIEGLSKMFRKNLGISPATYVTQVRIKEASHLLIRTVETIDWIALTTGFVNRNHFSHVFKKVTANSPAEFRRLHS